MGHACHHIFPLVMNNLLENYGLHAMVNVLMVVMEQAFKLRVLFYTFLYFSIWSLE